MVSLVLLPLKFELYPQRTNKKVSQGDSYNPEMKRRKQSICRPMCFLLAVVYLKDKICFRHFYSTISIVPQSFNVMYIYNTYITWTSIRHTHISLSFFVSLSLSLSGPFDFSHSSPFQLKYMLKKRKRNWVDVGLPVHAARSHAA